MFSKISDTLDIRDDVGLEQFDGLLVALSEPLVLVAILATLVLVKPRGGVLLL